MGRTTNKINVGDVFGTYTVVEILPNKAMPSGGSRRMCRCKCSCGVIKDVQVDNLINGNSKSCGAGNCSTRRQTQRDKYGYKEAGEQARNYIFLNYQSIARQKKRSWELSFEDFCEITAKDCYYCGAPPSNSTKDKHGDGRFVYNGIDRVDASKGYELDNILPACIICNRAKTDIALDTFIEWAKRIAEKHKDIL